MAYQVIGILGCQGMLGSDLAQYAESHDYTVRYYDLPKFDINNDECLDEIAANCDVIVNCAAYTDVEKAETDTEMANRVNGHAVGRLGRVAKRTGIPLLHISTDFVFDGKKQTPYIETDIPNPVNEYGRSKLLGEKLLMESGCRSCILRIEWTYGQNGGNFITKILSAADRYDQISVVDDQIGSPTYTAEVAKVIVELLSQKTFPIGIYHCAARGYVSRYELAQYLFERIGRTIELIPSKTSDYKTVAQRPLNSRFDCTKLEMLLNRPISQWQEMLGKYLEMIVI